MQESDGGSYLLIFHFHVMPACSKMVALWKLHLVTRWRGQASDEGEGSSNASRTTTTLRPAMLLHPFLSLASRMVGLYESETEIWRRMKKGINASACKSISRIGHACTHTHAHLFMSVLMVKSALSMQMTFIMQMHANQTQPSENQGWEKKSTQRYWMKETESEG